eukprot:TRINITY_DN55880_c0_g1_i1.p1 TRINITY_DN55880_c0_g1~~TRINITY_DN55880_c0_g1_i1.p1  ORF type:complete len:577 (-),score=96.05 TRINITY_DN55880_c0_g1_i1:436-2166(-)
MVCNADGSFDMMGDIAQVSCFSDTPMKVSFSKDSPLKIVKSEHAVNVFEDWHGDAMGAPEASASLKCKPDMSTAFLGQKPVISERVQRANDVLQAAIANWESCMQRESELAQIHNAQAFGLTSTERTQASELTAFKDDLSNFAQVMEMCGAEPTASCNGVASTDHGSAQRDVPKTHLATLEQLNQDLSFSRQLMNVCGGDSTDTCNMLSPERVPVALVESEVPCSATANIGPSTPEKPAMIPPLIAPVNSAAAASLLDWMKDYMEQQQQQTISKVVQMLQTTTQKEDLSAVAAAGGSTNASTVLEYVDSDVATSNAAVFNASAKAPALNQRPSFTPLNKHATPFRALSSNAMPFVPQVSHIDMLPSEAQNGSKRQTSWTGGGSCPARGEIGCNRIRRDGSCGGGSGGGAIAAHAAARDAAIAAGITGIGENETMISHLQMLQQIDPSRVVLVRKINRLGFESPVALKEHYSWYGTVETVLVSHCRVKSTHSQNRVMSSRLRPSGMGFVIMCRSEEVNAIIGEGAEQIVAGVTILVQRFHRQELNDHPPGIGPFDRGEDRTTQSKMTANFMQATKSK